MGVTVIICKFKDGNEQPLSKNEVESILQNHVKEKGHTTFSSGFAFLEQQPWFEMCEMVANGNNVAAILISKPFTEERELEEVIFKLLDMENSVLMSEHFDLFHSRTDMMAHFPMDMKEIMKEDDFEAVKVIKTSQEVWPADYKD